MEPNLINFPLPQQNLNNKQADEEKKTNNHLPDVGKWNSEKETYTWWT